MDFYKFGMANVKGDIGEVLVASELRNIKGTYTLRNIYLPNNDHTTEVDILWLTKRGIFCIECKNYSGRIVSDLHSKYWNIEYNCYTSEKLYSPLLQNKVHVEAISRVFAENSLTYDITPVVLFTDKVSLPSGSEDLGVFRVSDFVEWYKHYNPKEFLTSDDLNRVKSVFNEYSDSSDIAKVLHVLGLKLSR